ncbi:MAG: transcriptional repressor [Bacteroidales bacterium]|nr:transcriptional repressor [Bacteroidales bacterium]
MPSPEKDPLLGLIERHGIRPTANRLLIARALANQSRPLSMNELELTLETIDKSVISRTLALFREQHLVHVLEDGSDSLRYELCHSCHEDRDDDMHVHFHCQGCGRTFCLEELPLPPITLPEGYQPHTANYMVKGLCPDCRK